MLGEPCETCGNRHVRSRVFVEKTWLCDRCGDATSPTVHDVYFDGRPETNLVDDHGNPMVFVSKSHKARFLKEKNLREAGDKVHGAITSILDRTKIDNREKYRQEAREAIRTVRNMGKTVRRELINRIYRERSA
jgi:hypothetical protein